MPQPRTTRRATIVVVLLAALVGGGASLARSTTRDELVPQITDEAGRSLMLRGFSTAGSAKLAPDGLPDLTRADIRREYGDMGTNFVRLLISWRAVEPAPGEYDTEYLDALAERVAWYGDRGYKVMLDMHQDLWGSAITATGQVGNGAPAWATHLDGKPVADHEQWELYYLEPGVIRAFDNFWGNAGQHELQANYAGAWKAVAERFADDDTVIAYDLMNEPYGGSRQGPDFEAGALTDLYRSTTDAIRTVDGETWVCLEPQAIGVNWGTPSGLRPIGDDRVAYCPHLYPLPMDLGSGYTGATKALVRSTVDTWVDNTLGTASRLGGGDPVPVILGEFGLDTTSDGAMEYIDLVMRRAERHGFATTYWSRDAGSWGPYEDDGTPRNLIDAFARPYPRAVAGTLGQVTSGVDSLRFDVTPDPTITSPTEIYLPVNGFPSVTWRNGNLGGVDLTGATPLRWNQNTRILRVRIDGDARSVTVG